MKKLFGLIIFMASGATFANHNCTGEVYSVDISSNGSVYASITGIGDGNRLCSLESNLGEYNPEACKGVLSLALSAKMAQKKLRLYFRNDSDTSCSKGNWKNFGDSAYQLYHVRVEGVNKHNK